MIQWLFVALIFLGASAYLIKIVIAQFQAKSSCASGCGKCGVDFKKIENELTKKTISKTS